MSLLPSPDAGFDDPLALLLACHGRVHDRLALLQRLAAHLLAQGDAAQARDAATAVLRYFDVAAPLHHQDEERHVLPRLAAASDAALRELAGRLRREHAAMESAWAALRGPLQATAARGALPADAAQALRRDAEAFAALYQGHVAAEEALAFPAALAALAAAERRAMGAEMAQRRGVAAPPAGPGG